MGFINIYVEVIRKTYNTRISKMQGNLMKILCSDYDLLFQSLHLYFYGK